jgi:chromobox protein 1
MSTIYEVEAIRAVRTVKGKKEYFVKWEGYPESQNTWEPYSHLKSVKDMVREFEENLKRDKRDDPTEVADEEKGDVSEFEDDDDDRIPHKILLVKKINNKLHSKVQWRVKTDGTIPDTKWVPNTIMTEKFPEILIKYYEELIIFK